MTNVVQSACISWLSTATQPKIGSQHTCWQKVFYTGPRLHEVITAMLLEMRVLWYVTMCFLKRWLQLCIPITMIDITTGVYEKEIAVLTELVFDTPSLSCWMGGSHRVKAWPVYTKTQRSIAMPETTPLTCKRPKPMISSTWQRLSR